MFTDDELRSFEYEQDLSYYYTQGPGSTIPKYMWLPYLNSLLSLFKEGPGQVGVNADGSSFVLPDLLMNFFNDNQIAQLTAAMGIFDDQEPLPSTEIPDYWTYVTSRFISMRGTVAFEVLNCEASAPRPNATASLSVSQCQTSVVTTKTGVSTTETGTSTTVIPTTTEGSSVTPVTGSSTLTTWTTTVTVTETVSACVPSQIAVKRDAAANAIYVRIRLNDAVYPVVSCQDGPGNSCLLSKYSDIIAEKYSSWGNFNINCNVTAPGTPAVVGGASFYKNLTLPFLTNVLP